MIQNMVDERVSETKEQLGSDEYSEILEEQGKTEDEVAKDIEKSARKQLKRRMVLNEIAKQEEIEMTDEEFEDRLEEEAEKQDVNPIKFKNQLKGRRPAGILPRILEPGKSSSTSCSIQQT